MRKTKFLPKTPTCPVCMPHTWTRTPTNHRTLSNRLQPISPQDFGETERTFFSCVVDTVKRKNEGNSSSSWEATFVSVQLYLHSTKAQPQSPRGALYCKVDAAIIVMWRNVSFSHFTVFSFNGWFSLCFSAFAQADFPFLKQTSQSPSYVQLSSPELLSCYFCCHTSISKTEKKMKLLEHHSRPKQ